MLGNFHVRTDLALEARESFEEDDVKIRGVRVETREDEEKEIRTTLVKIETENGARTMGKPVGTYITMEAPNMSGQDEDYHREISEELAYHLKKMIGEREQSVLVVGASGFGRPVREAVHRPERFCELAGCSPEDEATPETVAAVIRAEGVASRVVVNQCEGEGALACARRLEALLDVPVAAGSLREGRLERLR